jgi:hypothetical protein
MSLFRFKNAPPVSFLERGILVPPVPISLKHWLSPERFPRPGFLRNVARDGIIL